MQVVGRGFTQNGRTRTPNKKPPQEARHATSPYKHVGRDTPMRHQVASRCEILLSGPSVALTEAEGQGRTSPLRGHIFALYGILIPPSSYQAMPHALAGGTPNWESGDGCEPPCPELPLPADIMVCSPRAHISTGHAGHF